MYTCQHCHTTFDSAFCPSCGVRRPVALIDQNPQISRESGIKTQTAALVADEKVGRTEKQIVEPEHDAATPVADESDQPQTMLEAMFGRQAIEAFTYTPKADDGLPLAGLRAYFSTGGSAAQAMRIMRLFLKGDARAAAQCSLSAYGRKSWFFLLPHQAVIAGMIGLAAYLMSGGELLDAIARCAVLWGAALLMLALLTGLLGVLLDCALSLPQTLSLVFTSALPMILLLPFACLSAWLYPQLLPGVLFLCAFAVLGTLYTGVEFVAMYNGRRSFFLFVLAMAPEVMLVTLLVGWLIPAA